MLDLVGSIAVKSRREREGTFWCGWTCPVFDAGCAGAAERLCIVVAILTGSARPGFLITTAGRCTYDDAEAGKEGREF
ncbi:hypothetical protein PAXINDRAFT_20341 [Paxillus involutus ATCC 200175]|uniref:Uncharacterized protein n=1 Tax=Paxillus involutus ATCC 200175 TaxID=664439 RepID=A0A0C9TE55_PAXIN|nr:hypothetical protein PAXINDRAFT_20341 [Paxillus involutus ATCC 200175]